MITFNSVDEKTPEDGQRVIVISLNMKVKTDMFYSAKEKKYTTKQGETEEVLFWMPSEEL